MADDGLMLNFELPTDAFTAPKTKLKGGSWKDRLTARYFTAPASIPIIY
jgi:ATP-dependent RNA helicase DDX31/DBP7